MASVTVKAMAAYLATAANQGRPRSQVVAREIIGASTRMRDFALFQTNFLYISYA